MAKRVFELARELGVPSKAVLLKCRAEGLEIKNHMSALSAGLAATIGEWFSEASTGTAVETAEHVDLAAAQKRAAAQRRRRKKIADEKETPPGQPDADGRQDEQPAGQQAQEPAAKPSAAEASETPDAAVAVEPAAAEEAPEPRQVEQEDQPAAVAQVEAPEEALPKVPEPPKVVPNVPEAPKVVPNVPEAPKTIKPAGPQVVPEPAKLHGPRVVRFDGIEPNISPPRSGGARRAKQPPRTTPTRNAGPAAGDVAARGRKPPGAASAESKTQRSKRRSPRRKSGRTVEPGEKVREWRDRDLMERSARLAAAAGGMLRRSRGAPRRGRSGAPVVMRTGQVEIAEPITVKSLSSATGIKAGDIIRKLLGDGIIATINQTLDRDMAQQIAAENGIQVKIRISMTAEDLLAEEISKRKSGELIARAPVATFLGHVDHGKTSLLDRIRHAAVAQAEEGGITQHIGSYRCDVGDKSIVFLDTPGHEAFTAMRARGANMTDVVVLVVAADDGVMPQTVEAISHAKAADVPIVVALNKIDLPNANVQRALGQLAERGLQPREWGGQTEVIKTSAETGEGIDELLETLVLEAELLELKSDPAAAADGWVVEARRDPNKGVLADLLVREGTLRVGDVVLCGGAYGRVRNILDDRGKTIREGGPATPVRICGLDGVPEAGDRFCILDDLSRAKAVAQERRQKQRDRSLAASPQTTLENLFDKIEAGESSEIRLIVKADVQGSLEALLKSLGALEMEEVRLTVLHSGVGGITEGDVVLAEASGAIILGFRVAADSRARAMARQKAVEIRTYRVIYHLLEEIEQALHGMLAPEMVEEVTGRADVREVFKISRVGTIAGCYVTDGLVTRSASVRLIRDGVVVTDERKLESLRRFKDDVRDVRAGMECGLRMADFNDIKVGDIIEAYKIVEVARQPQAKRSPAGAR